jgi:uncharacterized protein (DUF302 family)
MTSIFRNRIPFVGGRPVVFVFVVLTLLACGSNPGEDPAPRYTAQSSKTFDDVLADLEFAIGEENFRITGRNTIGAAIAQRHDRELPAGTVVHLCNLEYARQFLELAPDYLLHMPCRIAVYEQDDKVTVEARLLPENDPPVRVLSQRINETLKTIVSSAVE